MKEIFKRGKGRRESAINQRYDRKERVFKAFYHQAM